MTETSDLDYTVEEPDSDTEDEAYRSNQSQSVSELLKPGIQPLLNTTLSIDGVDIVDNLSSLSGNSDSNSSILHFDLSKVDSESEICSSNSMASSAMKDVHFKLKVNHSFEMIPQQEKVIIKQTKVSSLSSFTSKNYSSNTLDDIEGNIDSLDAPVVTESLHIDLGSSANMNSYYCKYPLLINQNPMATTDSHATWQIKNNLKLKYQQFCSSLEKDISELKRATGMDEIKPLESILKCMIEAWDFPVFGRDLAYALCDIIRNEGVLSLLIKNCVTDLKEVLIASTNLLEQVMSLQNREEVTKEGLETVVKMTYIAIGDRNLALSTTGILENLFKVNEEVSAKVIQNGGLDTILYWCRSNDNRVLRKCAKALSNLSLFGGPENQLVMTQKKVPEWLFPLAFIDDKHVKYYACLSITALVANKELESQVLKSGTLELVIPFVTTEKPDVFAKSDYAHRQGRDPSWLVRLIPLLSSRRPEAKALAAFHFAMEASIKAEQGKCEVFYEIGVIDPLKKVASSPDAVASRLAREALRLIGEEVPHKLSQQVPLWNTDDVTHWVTQIGFANYAAKFDECKIDGDLLLQMCEEDLKESINMQPGMIRRRFLRELVNLKLTADYSSLDPTKIDPWIMSVLPELSQYTYVMLRNGMDRDLLSTTSDGELRDVCGVQNGIHRRIILQHLEGLIVTPDGATPISSPYLSSADGMFLRSSFDGGSSCSVCPRPVDVFISYRRSTGSQLASLLKVHLQLRGFSVFLDIDRLRAGKFDENLLMNIKLAKFFLLVLTSNALDRCVGDVDQQDWVHKEIVTALESGCVIIPVLDSCQWPAPEQLPEDIQQVCEFNGINWVHEYQDACINKLDSFLRGKLKSLPDKMNHTIVNKILACSKSPRGSLTPQASFDIQKPSDQTLDDTTSVEDSVQNIV